MRTVIRASLLLLAALVLPAFSAAAADNPEVATLCGALEAAAARNGLPYPFFTRLIWQESHFDPTAVSPAGAQGVAQFMPSTAAGRGLADPFEPARALDESAGYLRELRTQFGNLGLAAAAYNAGPGRLARWLAGTAGLPSETIGYVEIVTGHSAAEWRATPAPALAPEPDFSCLVFTRDAGRRAIPAATGDPGAPPYKAWAVILGGSFNRAAVMAEYATLRATLARVFDTNPVEPIVRRRHLGGEPAKKYVVQVEMDNRAASNVICRRLEAAGRSCVVLRNSSR